MDWMGRSDSWSDSRTPSLSVDQRPVTSLTSPLSTPPTGDDVTRHLSTVPGFHANDAVTLRYIRLIKQ